LQWLIPRIYLARLQMLPAKSRCRPGDSPRPARYRSAASKTLGRSILRWRQGNYRPRWRHRQWRRRRWGHHQNRRPLQEIRHQSALQPLKHQAATGPGRPDSACQLLTELINRHQKQNAYSLKAPKRLFCTSRAQGQQAKINRKL